MREVRHESSTWSARGVALDRGRTPGTGLDDPVRDGDPVAARDPALQGVEDAVREVGAADASARPGPSGEACGKEVEQGEGQSEGQGEARDSRGAAEGR